ncbi:glutamine amidotransferase-like domain-containing protein [Rhizobium etli bv. phaseoli str. IE4803]|nr:glutamine amidotransferase-like domain-containing protein [Rhizobium etli bv. phaseoli str. IE4803]
MNEEAAIRFLILIVEGDEGAGNPEVDLARIAIPYYAFRTFGSEVVMATSEGGPPMLVDGMRSADVSDEAIRRFKGDRNARDELADSLGLDQIVVEDFAAAFCIGLSGRIWTDDDRGVAALVRGFLGVGKPVALVPGKHLLVAPGGAGNGLLILGDNDDSPLCAARALINVVADMRRDGRV